MAEGDALDARVSLGVAVAMLIVATVAAATWAAHRLRSLALTGED